MNVRECCIYRVTELESNMRVIQERVTQLQVEKEKALADLINIRKINRTIERLVECICIVDDFNRNTYLT